MNMTLGEFNTLSNKEAAENLYRCCGASMWVNQLLHHFPFQNGEQLTEVATEIWYRQCTANDWLEAFTQHPKIGDVQSLKEKFKTTQNWASHEQSGVQEATDDVINQLAEGNKVYEEKFGFIFIVCATGKTAFQMLRLLQSRLQNSYEDELRIAMNEQHKITILRLQKLLEGNQQNFVGKSKVTTHVLDTSIGKPATDVVIQLQQKNDTWQALAQSITDKDGRITDLLPAQLHLPAGSYKLVFDTGVYFNQKSMHGFYPQIEIQFLLGDEPHYHVPLLLNPFGYATYRGS